MEMEEIAVKLAAIDSRSKSNEHRIDEVEKKQDNLDQLVASVAVFAKEQEYIKADVGEIKADVKALADKPAKRWDGLMDKIILILAGAFIAWLASGASGL